MRPFDRTCAGSRVLSAGVSQIASRVFRSDFKMLIAVTGSPTQIMLINFFLISLRSSQLDNGSRSFDLTAAPACQVAMRRVMSHCDGRVMGEKGGKQKTPAVTLTLPSSSPVHVCAVSRPGTEWEDR